MTVKFSNQLQRHLVSGIVTYQIATVSSVYLYPHATNRCPQFVLGINNPCILQKCKMVPYVKLTNIGLILPTVIKVSYICVPMHFFPQTVQNLHYSAFLQNCKLFDLRCIIAKLLTICITVHFR